MNKNLKWGCAIVVLSTISVSATYANIVNSVKPILFIPTLDLAQGQPIKFDVTVGPGKPAIGFLFEGTYFDDGPGANTWWASDLQMQIISPSGNVWTVGGWNDTALGASDENWNGWNGSSPGPTAANGGILPTDAFPNDGLDPTGAGVALQSVSFPWKDFPKDKEGVWSIAFATDFTVAGAVLPNMRWTDVTISLLNVPSPGAISMLGLAGLCALRRRR
jgi:hypothetical protein